MEVPNQRPALIGLPPNMKYATNGYIIVAIKPNTVMTATAYAVSSSLAFMIGLVATIAETPHMEVPTAMRVPRRLGCLSLLFRNDVIIKALEMHITTMGIPINPNSNTLNMLNLIPKNIIPSFNNFFTANLNPIFTKSGNLITLLIINPKIKHSITAEIGDFSNPINVIPRKLLSHMLKIANKITKIKPGKIIWTLEKGTPNKLFAI
jgi:hypothetical protein